ncbi:MAG: hypothetical protein QOJ03_18 [Frankiaceae bacterium]|jgi:hypothetical protein|nr:hypothetical protein [Frankiaceae bacterium]
MRVYLAATLPALARWLADGQAPPGPAHAVTPALREWYREGSEEEMEYVASLAAGRSCLDLLAVDLDAPRRRVVVAAEVADLDVAPAGPGRSGVVVGAPVPVSRWASALVDDEDSEAVVSAAVTALGGAVAGDDDAAFALDEAGATELAWYAVQELPDLLAD